jgi:hypothetical protein
MIEGFSFIGHKGRQSIPHNGNRGVIFPRSFCGFLFFFLLQTGSLWLMLSGNILLFNIAQVSLSAAQPTFYTEMFRPRMRYTGASMGSQLCAILAGGFLLFIAKAWTTLDITPSWYTVPVYSVVTSFISAVAAYFGPETSRRIITEDPPR